jgi:hypothetical protein
MTAQEPVDFIQCRQVVLPGPVAIGDLESFAGVGIVKRDFPEGQATFEQFSGPGGMATADGKHRQQGSFEKGPSAPVWIKKQLFLRFSKD